MRVALVVALLVVDRRNIARDPACQFLRKCAHQRLALLRCGLNRQSDDETLAGAPFAPLGSLLDLLRCCCVC